ncbi:MAG: methyltransferase domain-containing protein [Melioribacteraceae bacterium]|nr:methyltransferase domain-containing protein [Melioribacteraceae bacterium]GJQ64407.1 MAG: SAM-dependent methyltransferase [Melioribacteraceae bacterium]
MIDNKKTEKIKNRYNRISKLYDLVEKPMENMFSKHRKEMLKDAYGNVLEVGAGTGKNFKYYPGSVEVTAIDFSPKMVKIASEKAKYLNNIKDVLEMNAENMTFDDDTFDTVVTSCVFCSVPHPVKGLTEIRRVCKSGGKILLLEHVKSTKPVIGPLMDILNPIPLNIYGANINRNTIDNLRKAGFQNIFVEDLWLDILKLITIRNDK